MKKGMLIFCAACLLLLTACGSNGPQNTTASTPVPSTTQPAQSTTATTTQPALRYDLAYDMNDYSRFSLIFEEKTPQQWEEMGSYTLLLNGFKTPVIVEMDGMTVLSVSAYGQTAVTDIATFQGDTPANIQSAPGVIVVNETLDHEGSTWLLTAEGVSAFHPVDGISTQVFVTAEGALRYRAYWGEYVTTFEQWDYAPLEHCTGRDHFLYENGAVVIVDGQVIFQAEETVTVSDLYDLDALFESAKSEGMYPEYNFVDELFAANGQK